MLKNENRLCPLPYEEVLEDIDHFSCSVKTVECGQIFLLACRQLRKKGTA